MMRMMRIDAESCGWQLALLCQCIPSIHTCQQDTHSQSLNGDDDDYDDDDNYDDDDDGKLMMMMN